MKPGIAEKSILDLSNKTPESPVGFVAANVLLRQSIEWGTTF
jgi:hypothetical protein